MILPASYSNGFAPRDGQPLYPELWRGCVGAWNPGLGPSGLTLRDNSGLGNNGTLTNGPTFAASQGKYAMNFDGADDYVSISASRLPSAANPWTISLWEYPTAFGAGNYGTSVSWGTTGGVWFQSVILANNGDAGDGRLAVGQYARNVLTTTTARPLNLWTHTAIVYSGGTTLQAYQNGLPNGSGPISNAFNATLTAAAIGRLQEGGQQYNGRLDDIRIYNRAISANEIRTLATRRGIAYELAPRRRASSAVQFNRRRRLLLGST